MVPLSRPDIGEKELALVKEVLDSGWLAHGPKTKAFEQKFAAYVGVNHAVALNSCTSALQLAIQVCGIRGEVVLPSFTFVASANSVVNAGATPVFADVEYSTCNIDPEKIKEALTDKTEAIMPVHFAGCPCRMPEIMEIASENDLVVIEDSAECIGGRIDGRKAGSFGVGCFSFFPTKNMTTGEGGMLTTNDGDVALKAKTLRGHGIPSTTADRTEQKVDWRRDATEPGFNYRMCDVQSAIGLAQLEKLDIMNERRIKNARYLSKQMSFDGIEMPLEKGSVTHVYQMYTIKLDKKLNRDAFVASLREMGVHASVHFDPPVHEQTYYVKTYGRKTLPVTEDVSRRIVSLPMYPSLTRENLDTIVIAVEDSVRKLR